MVLGGNNFEVQQQEQHHLNNTLTNGYTVLFYEDSNKIKYKGNVIDGKANGYGILFYDNDENTVKYKGNFKDWKYDNFGSSYYENELLWFRGQFKNGEWTSGYGELFCEAGFPVYRGFYDENGDFHGHGILFYENSNSIHYIGNFDRGSFCGDGRVLLKNSKLLYEGSFRNNQFEGKGKCYICNGCLHYEGQLKESSFHGEGVMFFPDGKTIKYKGNFRDGKFHGYGTLYKNYTNITIDYEGEFINGEKNAQQSMDKFRNCIHKYKCLQPIYHFFLDKNYKLSRNDIKSTTEILLGRYSNDRSIGKQYCQ